ncbi:MAG: hypothetical protein H0X25_24190 [Acidobacteriales bacterium]|nr:hypothetical protein [Terriglobales bacterium]
MAQVDPPRSGRSDNSLAWEYYDTPAGREADIVNVVRCRIVPAPKADDVPGKIVACFRPSRAIQSIADETAVLYSQLLWNQLSNSDDYSLPDLQQCDLFSYLDAETTEDVIFIYLQCEGWVVVPNSRKADTMSYEFLAINRETHARAIVQVKTGNTPLDRAHWSTFPETVFLFQAHGVYTGVPGHNVVQLSPETIRGFMEGHFDVMPQSVQRWIRFAQRRTSAQMP